MKQLHLIGTIGNNLCVIQIPTSWTQEETKEMLERAFLVYMKEKENNSEFLSSFDEEELRIKFPKFDSKLIETISFVLKSVGTPISVGSGLAWQIAVQNFLLRNRDIAKTLIKLFNNPLKKEENAFLCANYMETLPQIVKVIEKYV